MPRTGADNIPHVAWTDHRILRISANATQSQIVTNGELAPIFSPDTTKRDLAMANYKAMLEGDSSLEARAWELLRQERFEITDDSEALDALGVLCAKRGDKDLAERSFRRVLELKPDDLTALSDLGTLQAKQGNLKEAISLLQSAFNRNEDISGLAINLARVQCAGGDASAARVTLQTTLAYNPDLQDATVLLDQLSDCDGAKH
jgi:Flp pilus assembly protein TadD